MTTPVGPEYGLEPLQDHKLYRPPVESDDLLANDRIYNDPTASEFGGVGGYVQPAPHVANATERLSSIYAIDPTDGGDEAGSVVPPELDGLFNSGTE